MTAPAPTRKRLYACYADRLDPSGECPTCRALNDAAPGVALAESMDRQNITVSVTDAIHTPPESAIAPDALTDAELDALVAEFSLWAANSKHDLGKWAGRAVAAITSLRAATRAAPVAPDALTFDAFRLANVTRCVKWHPQGINSWSPSDWLTAVTGELGELASLLKMRNRERDGLPGNKFSPSDKQVADEIADVLTYLDLLAAALGIDLGRAAVEKFNEVSERVGFPDRIKGAP